MDLVLTGTGSPLPNPDRAGPSTLVRAGGAQILVDAGRGVVMRLAAVGVVPAMLNAVLITHLHSDHICALNDIITTQWVMTQGQSTLRIYGPEGTAQLVERQLAVLEPDIGYRLSHHDALTNGPKVDVTELQPGAEFTIAWNGPDGEGRWGGEIFITAAATDHAPVQPTVGYRIEHDGVAAAIVGDTLPCTGVDQLARAADAYVQTVIHRDLVAAVPNEMFQDIADYHSGVIDAAQTAQRVRAKRLVLTHMVPAPTPEQYPDWIARAAAHFDGEIIIGDDLTTLTV